MNSGKRIVSVVITAAGRSTRMGTGQNKQYLVLSGTPVLARTIRAFEDHSLVDEIIVTAAEDELDYCWENIIRRAGFKKVKTVVPGGASRQASVFQGLGHADPACDIVLIHDGARPFIDSQTISACIEEAAAYGAAIAAVPVKDTIKRSGEESVIEETLERDKLWSVQTPQAFRYGLILDAHRRAMQEGYTGTDDAILAERLGLQVRVVYASYYNIKITTSEDLIIAEAIASMMDEGKGQCRADGSMAWFR